jgi:hypothetical protein
MKKKASIEERVKAYIADEQALLKKHHLNRKIIIAFRHHEKPPRLARFAIWLLGRCQANTEILLTDNTTHG